MDCRGESCGAAFEWSGVDIVERADCRVGSRKCSTVRVYCTRTVAVGPHKELYYRLQVVSGDWPSKSPAGGDRVEGTREQLAVAGDMPVSARVLQLNTCTTYEHSYEYE